MNSEKKHRGPAPINTNKIAKFLLEHLRIKRIDFLSDIAAAAGAAGLIGKPSMHNGRPSWSGFNGLYRGIDALPTLPPPDDGWIIATSKDEPALKAVDGRARWQLRRANSPY
jgi:hypothetical protein